MRAVTVEPGQSIYATTKAGLIQMVRGLAVELGPAGIRVNCIAPGVVETPLTAPIKSKPEWYQAYSHRNALDRWATADEMAGPGPPLMPPATSPAPCCLSMAAGQPSTGASLHRCSARPTGDSRTLPVDLRCTPWRRIAIS